MITAAKVFHFNDFLTFLLYKMTQGAAQQRGRQIGTTAAPPLDSDSPPLGSISPTCLRLPYTLADPKSAKRQSSCQCLFALLRSASIKATHIMLVKLTPALVFVAVLAAHLSSTPSSIGRTQLRCGWSRLSSSRLGQRSCLTLRLTFGGAKNFTCCKKVGFYGPILFLAQISYN